MPQRVQVAVLPILPELLLQENCLLVLVIHIRTLVLAPTALMEALVTGTPRQLDQRDQLNKSLRTVSVTLVPLVLCVTQTSA